VRAQAATGAEEHPGVKDVKVDLEHERVIVTFDARKTHAPDLHDAILSSGYKPAPIAD
jgi:copper chaperone CopZ